MARDIIIAPPKSPPPPPPPIKKTPTKAGDYVGTTKSLNNKSINNNNILEMKKFENLTLEPPTKDIVSSFIESVDYTCLPFIFIDF